MYILSVMRLLPTLIIALSLSGCAYINPESQESQLRTAAPKNQPSIDALLAFGASMAKMSKTSQSELCKSLLDNQKNSPSDEVKLHLMVGRLLSDSCGDIPKLLEDINALKPNLGSDENLQRLIALHTQVLAEMQAQESKIGSMEHNQRKVKSILDAKGVKKKENRLLREKLEAIRSLEKQLDESSNKN